MEEVMSKSSELRKTLRDRNSLSRMVIAVRVLRGLFSYFLSFSVYKGGFLSNFQSLKPYPSSQFSFHCFALDFRMQDSKFEVLCN